jgi:hypothetical protein
MDLHSLRLWCGGASTLAMVACGGSPATPAPTPNTQTPSMQPALNQAAIVDALEYWQSAAGISYVLVTDSVEPRILIRPGTDGLAPQGGGRALIDGTYADNRARLGLVVLEPGGGSYCRTNDTSCRYLHRHEIGHALGFLGHSDSGLMRSGPDTLSERERRMIVTLYSLPHGARVELDGRWSVPGSAVGGQIEDIQAAQDIASWNMNATGGASFRQQGMITRWELPVRVFVRP